MYDKSTPFGRLFVAANELNRNILRHNDLARFLQIDRQQLHNWKSRGIPKARIIDLCFFYSEALWIRRKWRLFMK